MRIALGLAIVLLLAYLAILALLYSQQRRFLFVTSQVRTSAAEAGLPDFQDVTIETSDGERLVALWKPPEPGRALILYFHGNGGSLWNRRERARLLVQDGRGLLLVSYRGYSGSTGSPSEAGLRLDAEAAYRWLGSYAPDRIVLYGESLGTGVAIRLATERPVAGLILDAPHTSIPDVARSVFWYVPLGLLMRDQFRSIDRIARIHVPLLVMHGERDGVIPRRPVTAAVRGGERAEALCRAAWRRPCRRAGAWRPAGGRGVPRRDRGLLQRRALLTSAWMKPSFSITAGESTKG